MNKPISITAIASISPLGKTTKAVWENYKNQAHHIKKKTFENDNTYVAEIPKDIKNAIEVLKQSNSKYNALDNTVLYAIYASREAIKKAKWNGLDNFGINIGSSRGATQLFETYHSDFIKNNKAKTLSSPTTTLGNISSWVAHDLQTQGPEISHSITCSTALHAMLNGIAWINSGMSEKFLVGGSEAPLTPFTIAQMQALKIYSKLKTPYPCMALDFNKTQNTMVLGEGSAMACLEVGIQKNALALIKGFGYATEILKHNTSISSDAKCFQKSMRMALGDTNPDKIDIIVMHAPGTVKGDLSEYNAIKAVFKNRLPALTNNKWKIGHTFGASGMLSIEFAILMLQNQDYINIPYLENNSSPSNIATIMVNAVGFGGNAVSIILSKS